MQKKSSIALFLAATSALAISSAQHTNLKASENDLGGLKEWNTDMPLDADFKLDARAQELADEAKESSVCVPIGEGENCWWIINFKPENIRKISLSWFMEKLINLNGKTQGMLVSLGQKNIKKLTDFADLSSDELIGGYDEIKGKKIRIDGYLEEFSLSRKEADDLIMSAREIAYK